MSGRERLTGRILNVWEEPLGTTLTADAAAGTTVLSVDDVSPFNAAGNDDGSGGMLQVGDQVVQYLDIDNDASTITLAAPLPTAGLLSAENDDVLVWNEDYAQVDTVKWALVRPGGSRQQADPIQAVVADSAVYLRTGDRGSAGEVCSLVRDGDEWHVTDMPGVPSGKKGVRVLDDVTTVGIPLADRKSVAWNAAAGQWESYGPVVLEGTTLPTDPTATPWQFFVKHT